MSTNKWKGPLAGSPLFSICLKNQERDKHYMEKPDQGQEHGLHGVICHYPTPYCRGDQKILTLIAKRGN